MSRVFFIDRDLGRHILPGALERAGFVVERHDLHFEPDTPDEVWIPQVAQRGWVIVSGAIPVLAPLQFRDWARATCHRGRPPSHGPPRSTNR